MVTIINHRKSQKTNGEEFNSLVLQGGVEAVQSKETGRFYLTARKSTISTTFDEATCMGLIGMKLPGTIEKVECDPYEYTIESTGESLTLNYNWRYNPNQLSFEESVHETAALFA